MPVSGAKERIDAALQGWSGITAQPHRFGGTEYRLEKSVTCMVTAWWIFPFRRRSGMSWWSLVAPNHTTFCLRAAG